MCCHQKAGPATIRTAITAATGTVIHGTDWHLMTAAVKGSRAYADKAAVTAQAHLLADALSMNDNDRSDLIVGTASTVITTRMLAVMESVTADGLPDEVANRHRRADSKIILSTVIPAFGIQASICAAPWTGKAGKSDLRILQALISKGAERRTLPMTYVTLAELAGVSESTIKAAVPRLTDGGWLKRSLVSVQIQHGRRQQRPCLWRVFDPAALIDDARAVLPVLELIEGKSANDDWAGASKQREVLRAIQALAAELQTTTLSCPAAFIAERAGISRPAAKKALDGLVQRGYLTRGVKGADYRLAMLDPAGSRRPFTPTLALGATDIFQHSAGFPHSYGAVLSEICEQPGSTNSEIVARSGYASAQVDAALDWAVATGWVSNPSGQYSLAAGVNIGNEMASYAAEHTDESDTTPYLDGLAVSRTMTHSMVGVARRRGIKMSTDAVREARRLEYEDRGDVGRFEEDPVQDDNSY